MTPCCLLYALPIYLESLDSVLWLYSCKGRPQTIDTEHINPCVVFGFVGPVFNEKNYTMNYFFNLGLIGLVSFYVNNIKEHIFIECTPTHLYYICGVRVIKAWEL